LGVVENFPPDRLAFAWAKTDQLSAILGQVNFLLEFEVCFFRAREQFDVRPSASSLKAGLTRRCRPTSGAPRCWFDMKDIPQGFQAIDLPLQGRELT
jgi:hypothetical protein